MLELVLGLVLQLKNATAKGTRACVQFKDRCACVCPKATNSYLDACRWMHVQACLAKDKKHLAHKGGCNHVIIAYRD